MVKLSGPSKKCMMRVGVKKSGELKFCGKPAKHNDLCYTHDRKYAKTMMFGARDE